MGGWGGKEVRCSGGLWFHPRNVGVKQADKAKVVYAFKLCFISATINHLYSIIASQLFFSNSS